MTIVNESIRLFFAIFALILVGMLSTPTNDDFIKPVEIKDLRNLASAKSAPSPTKTELTKKTNAKKITKVAKTSRKVARRG